MADSKITALTAISTVDPTADPLVIVDVSDTSMAASGTTKKSTINQLLGSGGTATLASATITGDLTVDTSTLKVDSANNRVGIGTASPAASLHVASGNVRLSDSAQVEFGGSTNSISGSNASNLIEIYTNNLRRNRIDSNGVATWSNVGGVAGDAMTLNSTGLGIGASPTEKLTINNSPGAVTGGIRVYANDQSIARIAVQNTNGQAWHLVAGNPGANNQGFAIYDYTNSATRMYFDTSGNVGIGVTPSASDGTLRTLNVGYTGVMYGFVGTSEAAGFGSNYYYNAGWKYRQNGTATNFSTSSGKFVFSTSASGTAGNAITWTDAMTLDASGNLLVGTTSSLSSVSGSSQIALGGAGLQTTSQAISAATATTICRSGSGGMAVVGGYNGTGQYSAIIIFSYGTGGGVTVVSSQNNTGSTITYALSGVNVQVTSSLALTNLTTTCIRTA